MKYSVKIKTQFILFSAFLLFCSGLFLTFGGLIFAGSANFPSSYNAGMSNYAPINDFAFDDSDPSMIIGYKGTSQSSNTDIKINVPKNNGNVTITGIGESAFSYDEQNRSSFPSRGEIVGIVIPETINSIGKNVFVAMPKLKWIIINSTDEVQIANDFLGSSDKLPSELKKIYLPQISRTRDILNGKILPAGLDILYSEDCYETEIYQDEESKEELEKDAYGNKYLKIDNDTKQCDFIFKNSGAFQSEIGFEFSGADKDMFSVIVDNITLVDGQKFKFDPNEIPRVVVKMNNNGSKNIINARLKIINYSCSDAGKEIDEIILKLDRQESYELPIANENLVYNGNPQSLIDENSIVELPVDWKMQFSFNQRDWIDIAGNFLPNKTDSGSYILYLRLIDGDKKVIDRVGLTVNISKRKLKLNGTVKFEDKEYDGKEQVNTLKSGLEIISGEEDGIAIVNGDNVGISYDNLRGYLDHENENVGNDKAVKIEGSVYLTGDSIANYELDDNFDRSSTVNIIPRKIKISGSGTITVLSREYNGLKNVELDTSDLNEKLKVVHVGDSEIGIIKQDDVSLDFSKLVGEMEDKNAGENKIVNINGNIVLVGSYKDNYELVASESDPFNKTATVLITKKGLMIKGDIRAINKAYDKNNSIELVKSKLVLDGKIDGDDININFDVIKGSVENPKAGQNKKVIINFDGELISGADLINYEFSNPEFDNVFVDITPKKIGLSGDFEIGDKKYDGTNDIKFKADSIKLNTEEIYEGDEVELKSKNLSAKSEDANVGQKNVAVSGEWFLVGNDAESYVLEAEDINRILSEKIVNITPLPAEFVWSDKTNFDYDGEIHQVTAIVKNRKAPNDMFDLKYDNNTAGNSGSYVAKVTALGNENYTLENAINATKKWSIRDVFHGGGGGGGFSSGGSSSSSRSNIANNINTNILSPSIGGTNGFMTSGKTLKDIVVPNTVKQRKYMQGYPDKTFRPNGNMTRAEFSQAIYNLINNNESVNINVLDKFNDVDKKAWYAKAMAYLSEKNIIKGYDGKIRPNDFVTRGELAQMLCDVLKSYDNTGTSNYIYGNYDSSFVDLDNNYWAVVAIRQLASNGMLNGYENKTFRPKANVTRAEVVAMISKVFGRSFDLSVTKEYIDVGKNHWAYNYILDANE